MMRVFLTVLSFFLPFLAMAQWYPSVDPVGTYYKADKDGGEESGDVNGTTQSAPLKVVFQANPSNIEELGTPSYEWKIWNRRLILCKLLLIYCFNVNKYICKISIN